MEKKKNRIALLCLIIFFLLIALSVLQENNLLPVSNLGVIAIYALIFALPLLIYRKTQHLKAANFYNLHAFSPRWLPHILVMSLAVSLVCGALSVVGFLLFSGAAAKNPTAMMSFSSQSPAVLFITMIFLPALSEEMLLRGAALSEYESFGTTRAVVMSAAVFALFHANPTHLLSLFTAGICYGVMTKLFGSIWPSVIAHMLNNALAVLIYNHTALVQNILSDALFIILALIALVLILVLALKMTESAVEHLSRRGKIRCKKRQGGSMLSFYLLVFALGCIGKMIYTYFL